MLNYIWTNNQINIKSQWGGIDSYLFYCKALYSIIFSNKYLTNEREYFQKSWAYNAIAIS